MIRRVTIISLIGVSAIFLVAFTTVHEAPKKRYSILDSVLEKGKLRVGVTADYVPFAYFDQKTKSYYGIDIDLARQLAKDMEVELELVPTTRRNLTRDILLGKFDVAMSGIPKTMKQTLITNMTTGYFESGKSLLVREEDASKLNNMENANGSKIFIGVKEATTSQKFAELYFNEAKIELYQTPEDLQKALKNGLIDAILTDNIEAKVLADNDKNLHAIDPYNPFNTEVLAFAMAPGDKKWQDFLNLWLKHQLQEGEILRLQEKWIGK